MIELLLKLDINATEEEFINQVVEDNEGDAIQAIGNGRASGLAKATPAQKKEYVVKLLSRDFEQRFINAQIEKQIGEVRKALQQAELDRKAGKPNG